METVSDSLISQTMGDILMIKSRALKKIATNEKSTKCWILQ